MAGLDIYVILMYFIESSERDGGEEKKVYYDSLYFMTLYIKYIHVLYIIHIPYFLHRYMLSALLKFYVSIQSRSVHNICFNTFQLFQVYAVCGYM